MTATEVTSTTKLLAGRDRCDVCQFASEDAPGKRRGLAAASVRVLFPSNGKTLDFCKHHFEANEAHLFLQEREVEIIIDQRETLHARA